MFPTCSHPPLLAQLGLTGLYAPFICSCGHVGRTLCVGLDVYSLLCITHQPATRGLTRRHMLSSPAHTVLPCAGPTQQLRATHVWRGPRPKAGDSWSPRAAQEAQNRAACGWICRRSSPLLGSAGEASLWGGRLSRATSCRPRGHPQNFPALCWGHEAWRLGYLCLSPHI